MAIATLILLTLFGRAPAQDSPSAAIQAGGHTYQLFCRQEDELIAASETGLCEKTESAGTQRFEVRNEAGDVQFSQDAPEGKPFSYVGIFSIANAGSEILDVDTSFEDVHPGDSKPVHTIYYFDPAPSGLNPFSPPMVDVDGFAHLPTGVALSRTFDTGLFQFSVLLDFDLVNHRIEIMPDQAAFSAFPPHGRQQSKPSLGAGEIKLYSSHDSAANKTDVKLAPGHGMEWWQSPDLNAKPSTGQLVTILAAWAPVSLKQADNAADGVKMVYYDPNNLWLQIEVDGHTGWIKGSTAFRAIGLSLGAGQH